MLTGKQFKELLETERSIGGTENCYSGVCVFQKDSRYFWAVEGSYIWGQDDFEEITKKLYDALVEFDEKT